MNQITIRPATDDDVSSIGDVHMTSAMDVYNRILPQHALVEYSLTRRKWHEYITHGGASYVAMADDTIVGFLNVGKFRGDNPLLKGEVYELYVLPSHQRRKIGKALFRAGKQWLKNQQLVPFGLWVLSRNHARYFYQAMGGAILMQPVDMLGDSSLAELLFMFT